MRTLIIIFLQFIFQQCFCQISIDSDCLERNSMTVSRIMLELLGQETVQQMLDNKTRMLFILEVDSSGYVSEIKRIRTQNTLDKNVEKKLKRYFGKHKIQMRICYSIDLSSVSYERGLQIARSDFQNSKKKYIIVGFPGELFTHYEYYKTRGYKGIAFNSKLEYLMLRLNDK